MNYKSSSELKALAREQLKGKYGVPVGAVFLATLISTVVSIITTFFAKTDSVSSLIIYYLISFIISLLTAVLGIGLLKFFVKFAKNEKYQVSDIFWGFQNHPDKVILITIILTLLFLVCLLPGFIFLVVYAVTLHPVIFVIAIISMIAGVVGMVILGLNYSLTGYIIADEIQYSVIDTMKASRNMMRGHKGRLFYLQISFIGWYLLSLLSCGIALLWIEPYRMCTSVYFYLDLKGEFRASSIDERV